MGQHVFFLKWMHSSNNFEEYKIREIMKISSYIYFDNLFHFLHIYQSLAFEGKIKDMIKSSWDVNKT